MTHHQGTHHIRSSAVRDVDATDDRARRRRTRAANAFDAISGAVTAPTDVFLRIAGERSGGRRSRDV